jgi:hypothetical protein
MCQPRYLSIKLQTGRTFFLSQLELAFLERANVFDTNGGTETRKNATFGLVNDGL